MTTEDIDQPDELELDRRTVLKGAATASAMGFVGVPAFSGSAVAQPEETLYLSDTGGDNSSFDGETKLFEVDLVDGKAQLSELTGSPLPTGNFAQADAIAATPDGTTIDVIDKNSARLGRYTVSDDSFTDKGEITGISGNDEVVLATYSPGGTLYAAGQSSGELYTIDPDTPEVTSTKTISGVTVQGADIAFDSSGTLYLYSSKDGKLYTVDPGTGEATEVGGPGDKFTGLAIRDAGEGALVGSNTDTDQIVELDKGTGGVTDTFEMYLGGEAYNYGFGDMTVGELAGSTTFDLCAGQDTNVGTVTVTDSPDEITITYNTTGGWELYETHVDIGDETGDFPTTGSGNPKVGQFDLSGTHDGVTEVSYTVECGDDALDDVGDYSELFIAAHAVVEPTDGCGDFSGFDVGESVEGLGTVNPVLDIQSISSVSGAEAVAQKEGEKPATYGAPTGPGTGSAEPNGCLNAGAGEEGFSDIATKDAGGSHAYRFTFAEGVSVSDFSVRMLDFGDYNPNNVTNHRAEMVAYDEAGDKVDSQVLEYTSGSGTNPSDWEPVEGTTKENDDLQIAGDGCSAAEGEPGNYVWSVSGDAIVEIELEVLEGTDPNIAFADLCFEANDETAWPCPPQDNVESFGGGNWATYIVYDTLLFDC